jgi:hypothetical protein
LLIEENIKLTLKGTISNLFNMQSIQKIPAKMLALVGVKILLQSSLNFPSGGLLSAPADNFLLGGACSLPYLYLLFMFPIEGENNKRWENISTIISLQRSSITPKIQRQQGLFKNS